MADFYATGTVSVSNGSTTVTGSGVVWSEVLAGDTLELAGQRVTIASAPVSPYTSLTLAAAWTGTTQSGASYVIRYDAPVRFTSGYLATQVRSLVERTSIIESAAPTYTVVAVTNTPPGSPVANDTYAVGSSPTGAWSGNAGKLAQWTGSAWTFTTPEAGWQAYAVGDGLYVYDAGWVIQGGMRKDEYDPTNMGADAFDSANHAFDNSGTGLSATTVQAAIAEEALLADVRPEQFGAIPAVSNHAAAITALSTYCAARGITTVRTDGAVTVTTTLAHDVVADLNFVGRGSISGVYRKRVIPERAPSPAIQSRVSARSLTTLNAAGASPVAVIIGDSTGTWFANSLGRGDMLAGVIEQELQHRFATPVLYNRAVGGASISTLSQPISSGTAPWGTGGSKTYLSYAKDLAPDLLIFAFGMNDGASINVSALDTAIADVKTWPKVPSIIFCTPLVPSYGSLTYPAGATDAEQEARDKAAGTIRSYARYYGYGVWDNHRLACMVRDGFDPVSSIFAKGDTITAVDSGSGNLSAVGTRLCTDWRARVRFNGTLWADAGKAITFYTGSRASDFFYVQKVNSSTLSVFLAAGDATNSIVYYTNASLSFSVPTASVSTFVVEKKGGHISLYLENDGNYGAYLAPALSLNVIASGGLYYPIVAEANGTPSPFLISVDYEYGVPALYKPTLTDSQLWGQNASSGIGDYGGSGYNHPSGYAASHIYRPIILGSL